MAAPPLSITGTDTGTDTGRGTGTDPSDEDSIVAGIVGVVLRPTPTPPLPIDPTCTEGEWLREWAPTMTPPPPLKFGEDS